MHRLTFGALWLFVLSVPWELAFGSLPIVGSLTRLLGLATIALGGISVAMTGRFRAPGVIVVLAVTFVVANLLSLLWTISPEMSIVRLATYAQLVAVVWLIWEFARTAERLQLLIVAYCLGTYLSILDAFRRFAAGERFAAWATDQRYSGGNLDPNDFGVTLAIGIPMAWHLFLSHRGFLRIVGITYPPLAVIAILFTGSRGAFLAGLLAMSIVPLAAGWRSRRRISLAMLVLLAAAGAAAMAVPQSSWDRLSSIEREFSRGTLGGRTAIWAAGFRVFREQPLLGVGVGAFPAAVEPLTGRPDLPHNSFLGILVEQGIVGASLFFSLLGACVWGICRLPEQERRIWGVTICTWIAGAMSLGWETRKVTWLLFGLIAALAAVVNDSSLGPGGIARVSRRGLATHRRGLPSDTAA